MKGKCYECVEHVHASLVTYLPRFSIGFDFKRHNRNSLDLHFSRKAILSNETWASLAVKTYASEYHDFVTLLARLDPMREQFSDFRHR